MPVEKHVNKLVEKVKRLLAHMRNRLRKESQATLVNIINAIIVFLLSSLAMKSGVDSEGVRFASKTWRGLVMPSANTHFCVIVCDIVRLCVCARVFVRVCVCRRCIATYLSRRGGAGYDDPTYPYNKSKQRDITNLVIAAGARAHI